MIYVHVPFCRSFCTYCDFYSEVAARCRKAEDVLKQEKLFEEFSQALCAEAVSRAGEISDEVNTLYIGGGTPSVLPLSALRKILDTLALLGHGMPGSSKDISGLVVKGPSSSSHAGQGLSWAGRPYDEFTVEVNPEDIIEKGHAYVEGLLELGVNRISMGVQSFDDSVLKFMNRRHTAAEAVRAYAILEESGVRNISIDLMFGLPQLSMSQWRETLDKALAISSRGVLPQHISSYQLSVEPGSMLARLVEKGRWSEASEEVCQEQYAELCSVLASAGYNHYEVSNFARPGYEARHNSAYWSHTPYVGLGPGAHSFVSGHSMASFDSPLCPSSDSLHCPSIDSPLCPSSDYLHCPSIDSLHCPSNDSLHCPSSDSHCCHFERPKGVEKSFRRIWNLPDLQTYLDAFRHGDFSSVREGETLTMDQLTLEHIMLGLRTSSGLPASYLRTHCTPAALSRALSLGHLVPVPESVASLAPAASHESLASLPAGCHLRIPERHFFISDAIISALV